MMIAPHQLQKDKLNHLGVLRASGQNTLKDLFIRAVKTTGKVEKSFLDSTIRH